MFTTEDHLLDGFIAAWDANSVQLKTKGGPILRRFCTHYIEDLPAEASPFKQVSINQTKLKLIGLNRFQFGFGLNFF